MQTRSDRSTSPADLVALALHVQNDERAPRGDQLSQAKRLRDRLSDETDPPETDAQRVLWLIDHAEDLGVETSSRQARSALSIAGLILVVIGLLSGIALASGVFYYDGQAPVNIVAALGVFVVLQGLLLLLAVLASLPRAWVRWLPGMDGLQDALRLASPGRLALLGARLLPQEMREALFAAIGQSGAHQRIYGRVQLWAILRWSQLYAVAFNLAIVSTFFYFVVVSDLAFSWSTTLDIQPAGFHRLVDVASLPWFWLESARPSMPLVEASFNYRGTDFDRELSKTWWPFVLMAMLVYGLLPRLIALSVASNRLQHATRQALVATPGVTGMLSRLRSDPAAPLSEDETTPSNGTSQQGTLGTRPIVVDWSRAGGSIERAETLLGLEPAGYELAGGSCTVQADRAVIDSIGRRVTEEGVAVLVKLWEPPVIETTEFLRELRIAVGERLPIRVVPVAVDLDGRLIGDDPVLVEQWRRRVRAMGDPWTHVADPVGRPADQTEQADA